MGKIKIVYIIDTLQTGGAEKSLVDIAINNNYFDCVFITIYKGDFLVKILEAHNIKVYSLNIATRYSFSEAVDKLIPLLHEINPDVIHSTLFRSDIIARRLKKHFKIPLINSFVNNSYTNDRYSKLSLTAKLKLYLVQCYDMITAQKVDCFISNSETIKLSNAKALRINLDKIKVIYRGRNSILFDNISADVVKQLKIKLQLEGKTVFLNVSRLLDRKGQLDLITAFREVNKINPETVLLIAGEGSYRSELETAINEFGLEKSVLLLGNREDIPVLLKMADFFVFPSYYEGLPGALIEAMMAEKIIICSDIPENKECATINEVIFFSKGDIGDLKLKMREVIMNAEQYSDKGKAAKQLANQKFDINKVVEYYHQTYNELIQSHSK
ncbi:glycosyltransferase [Flavobacterium sangjuense]|uniref:Glycosyltransferase Gtf1 n=1 Tax=Flavobacterium sangjuense TaxID=2518177 RepID=A0A4P7PUE5_9FLAO|nr:glycosyltransferase [Flavobacterium sangjuense]QBZ97872.1 Glycosyltransferase Gtf1 [Flavobacterium sangjuense]